MSIEEAPIRVSISQAANLFGITERTIRTALRHGELHYVIVRNRYKINFDSLLVWSQKSTRRRIKRDGQGIGRYVGTWKIRNKKFSPNPKLLNKKPNEPSHPAEDSDETAD
ncbi:MAG: helix-turn-helix domain-containing protein [Patescibacteria group bacterium]